MIHKMTRPGRLARLAKTAGFLMIIAALTAALYAGGAEVVRWGRNHEAQAVAEAQRTAQVQAHETSIKTLAEGQGDIAKKLGEVREDVKYIRGRLDQLGTTSDSPRQASTSTPQEPQDDAVAVKP